MVELEPVGAGISPPGESADVELRSARVRAFAIRIEAGDAQLGSRIGNPVDIKIIDRIRVNRLAPDPEIVDQVRRQRVCIADGVVVGDGRNPGCVVLYGGAVGDLLVLSLVTEKEPGLIADILIDPIYRLVARERGREYGREVLRDRVGVGGLDVELL
jgi:hypothetical protein